jgi:membrane associated rhomboid family serine protease
MDPDPRQPDPEHRPAAAPEEAVAPRVWPPPAPPRPARFAPLREAPVAAGLVAINVAVLALVAWRFDDPTSSEALIASGALERGLIGAGQWWRLLTAVFLHIGWIHLLANSIFGFGWCRMVERAFGPGRFLALYLLAGVGASATSMATHDAIGAGASGALFGMIGATLVIHRRLLPGWWPFLRSSSTLSIAVQLGVWTVLAVAANLPIDHAAHFGGLATGAAAAWIMTRPAPRRPLAWLPFALAGAAMVAAAVWPRPGLSRHGADQSIQEALAALEHGDLSVAERQLGRLDAAGVRADRVELIRAVVAVGHDDLAGAASVGERLLRETRVEAIRIAARSVLANVGYRYYRGQGVPADAERGYRYIREACQAGLDEACRAEQTIRTGVVPVAPPGAGQ